MDRVLGYRQKVGGKRPVSNSGHIYTRATKGAGRRRLFDDTVTPEEQGLSPPRACDAARTRQVRRRRKEGRGARGRTVHSLAHSNPVYSRVRRPGQAEADAAAPSHVDRFRDSAQSPRSSIFRFHSPLRGPAVPRLVSASPRASCATLTSQDTRDQLRRCANEPMAEGSIA